MSLSEEYVLITGGTLGIGKATAKLLVGQGAKVAITGRDSARLERAAAATGAFPILNDVSKPSEVEGCFESFFEQFPRLTTLINNAGIGRSKALLDLEPEDMRVVWETNVLGATMMAKHASRHFVEQNSGTIINIASTAAHRGYARGSAYSSSKFALRSLSECWRAELRPHNVRVCTICPSEVPTAFGSAERVERPEEENKLRSLEIAHAIQACMEMDPRGFIPELTVFATNPF